MREKLNKEQQMAEQVQAVFPSEMVKELRDLADSHKMKPSALLAEIVKQYLASSCEHLIISAEEPKLIKRRGVRLHFEQDRVIGDALHVTGDLYIHLGQLSVLRNKDRQAIQQLAMDSKIVDIEMKEIWPGDEHAMTAGRAVLKNGTQMEVTQSTGFFERIYGRKELISVDLMVEAALDELKQG